MILYGGDRGVIVGVTIGLLGSGFYAQFILFGDFCVGDSCGISGFASTTLYMVSGGATIYEACLYQVCVEEYNRGVVSYPLVLLVGYVYTTTGAGSLQLIVSGFGFRCSIASSTTTSS